MNKPISISKFLWPHGTTDKSAGDARDMANVSNYFKHIGVPAQRVLFLKQVHSDNIATLHSEEDFEKHSQRKTSADAWVLSHPGTGCAVYSADCAPVFLWDKGQNVAGLVHSGWKPTVKNIAGKTAKLVAQHPLSEGEISAFIGPHIKQCCFEFGPEAHQLFNKENIHHKDGKIFVNLENQIINQLIDAGLKEHNIHTSGICTFCNNNFFSFRRDKSDSAIMSYIYKGAK